MQVITSLSNKLVKEIKALHTNKGRKQANLFLVEGANSIKEAIKDNIKIKFIGIVENYTPDSYILDSVKDIYCFTEEVFKKICSTDSPASIIAVCEKFVVNESILSDPELDLVVILDEIKDPGNLGTIIRTACAASASCIVLTDRSVDIFNPKVVRSSTGTLWKIPIIYYPDKDKLASKLKESYFRLYSADMNTKISYSLVNYKDKTAIVFGSEAKGVSKEFKSLSDELIKIPISDKVESLNVASSVAIILFEALKQKSM